MPFIKWAGAWLIFLLVLAALAKTNGGKTILYYLLWLAIVLLLLIHYQDITGLFSSAGITPQTGG